MTSLTRRVFLAAACGGMTVRARAAPGTPVVAEAVPFQGSTLTVTRYAARTDRPRPTVLLLHGSKGLEAHRPAYERYARDLAAAGLDAVLFTYYQPEDLAIIGAARDTAGREAHYARAIDHWVALVRNVGTWAKGHERSSGHIGILGFSLGGFVGVAAASEPLFSVLTVFYAGLPTFAVRTITFLPPVLDIHGEADRAVPLGDGEGLIATAKRLGGVADLVVFPGEGHGFDLDPANRDATRARQLAIRFTSEWIDRA